MFAALPADAMAGATADDMAAMPPAAMEGIGRGYDGCDAG